MVDFGDGELQLHSSIKGKITKSRILHFERVFVHLIAALMLRGMTYVGTWVPVDDEKSIKFCEFFGFEASDVFKAVVLEDGTDMLMQEMICWFPDDEDEE